MNAEKASGAVLLVAHGSRVPASNVEIEALAESLARRLGPEVTVTHAFLELARPPIPEAIDDLAGRGVRRIVLIPYFLSAGRHVGEDIPAIVADARRRHPALDVEITAHFGAGSAVPDLLVEMVKGVD